ncbi:MAG: riboflavin biosynthesis protein RibF [Flavobacteriales bacterium]|nr:riboflavin biosynthesis protein RibF [Flavobacteriales bacterium]
MKIHYEISDFDSNIKTIVAVGTFDGVHLGHKSIFDKLNKLADQNSLEIVLLTFSPHPRHVLFPEDQNLKLINTDEEKIEKIKQLGVQHLIIHEFTKEFSRMTSTDFVKNILVNKLNIEHLVVGHDHQFGKNREGSFVELINLAEVYNFDIHRVEAFKIENIKISSTKIRNAISSGNIAHANNLLGSKFFIIGKVEKGDQFGRKIGYPTANLSINKYKILPRPGVYYVSIIYNDVNYFGMLNIAHDTFKTEVHIFNFDSNIYNQKIKVFFFDRLRDEIKFDNHLLLKKQLQIDELTCKKYFNLLR